MTNKISLDCIVGKSVLCEFSRLHEESESCVGFLHQIENLGYYKLNGAGNRRRYDLCRIYQHPDYWIANPHGGLVLPAGLELYSVDHHADKVHHALETEFTFEKRVLFINVIGTAEGWSY